MQEALKSRSKILGDYQIGKTIGQGAFSKVKLGYHIDSGQKVAIKIIDKKLMAEKSKKSKEAHEEREKKQRERDRKKSETPRPVASTSERPNYLSSSAKKNENGGSSEFNTQYPVQQEESLNEGERESSDDFVSKLQLEVQLMLRLDHPNIVKVYQVIDSADETLIIMYFLESLRFIFREYAKGGELIEYIAARDRLSEKEARKFFRQIISAIDHCHLANVVHRDLKLENLLLNGERNILLSDFGLGRTFRDDLEEYMKTFCGTPNYAAVELISGIPYVGVKSDIWAMGVVLYLMVAGKPPFYGETISLLYKEIKAVNYKVYDYFSQDLRHLLSRMLCKDPRSRIDMNELRKHPWVNTDETEEPPRFMPRLTGNVDATALNTLIHGIHREKDYVVYIFREHVGGNKKPFWKKEKPAPVPMRQEPESVQEDDGPKETNSQEKGRPSSSKRNSFQIPTFFRRISFTSGGEKSPSPTDVNGKSSKNAVAPAKYPVVVTPTAEEPTPAVILPPSNNDIPIFATETPAAPQGPGLSIPAVTGRRHSGMGLTAPNDQALKLRRASGSGISFSGNAQPTASTGERPVQKSFSLGFQLMPNLSAMLRKSANTIAVIDESKNVLSSRVAVESESKNDVAPISPLPSRASAARIKRSSTFSNGNGSQLSPESPPQSTISPAHSPLPPNRNSIHAIRRATLGQTSQLEKRESFGAAAEAAFRARSVSAQPASPAQLSIPGANTLGVVPKTLTRSHTAFTTSDTNKSPFLDTVGRSSSTYGGFDPKSTNLTAHGHSGIARSAILSGYGQQVDDELKSVHDSRDFPSMNSRWTDQDESVVGSNEENEPSTKEIQEWHDMRRPAKTIRSMRFTFNSSTSSSLEPSAIFREVLTVLTQLNRHFENRFICTRNNPDYYLLTCKLKKEDKTDEVVFEIEVCKVWLLKLHGVRIKRIAGNPILFKELFSFIESALKI